MSLKDAILSLYNQEKLDKPTAYHLLSTLKQEVNPSAAPAKPRALTTEVDLPSEAWEDALALWVYFLHLLTAQEEITLAIHGDRGLLRLAVPVSPCGSFDQLREALSAATPLATDEDLPYAFFQMGSPDSDESLQAWASLRPGGLTLNALPEALGATAFEDWPDTLSHLLKDMLAKPQSPLQALDHLPERHRCLLETYNRTYAYLPQDCTLPGLLDPVLACQSDAPAVLTSTQTLTYTAFKSLAYGLGYLLRDLGARRNQLLPVICQRMSRMPALLYGVVQSGAAYVPLEPDYPEDRVLGILNDAQARIVVTDAATLHEDRFDYTRSGLTGIVCVDPWPESNHRGIRVWDSRAIAQWPTTPPANINLPGDLCYVIFTSGSTGKPKGVMISHLNIVNTLVGVNSTYGVNASDRVFCFSSYGFDLSVWDIFGSFLAGASVFVPSRLEIKHPQILMRILDKHRITIWDSVPTGMSQLLLPFLEEPQIRPLPDLRLAMLSGEFIPLVLPANIRRFFPHCQVSSLGGATEGTVWSIFHYPVDKVESHWKSIPYGKPLPNQRFYVLNEALRPCAVGQKGMLHIAGLGVAQGYYGDEAKTRAAFLPCPWPSDLGPTLYRTGDLGIFRADGLIDILGRADFQVKVRGFRVELGEVESQLSALPGIEQCAVLARKEDDGNMRLTAFYTRAQGELPAEELRSKLGTQLPDYMLPSQFIHLSVAPVNASGKLDRKALASHQASRMEMGQAYTAPQTEAEGALVEALQRILKLDKVGVDDHFFLIGGDSLLSLQYLSALRQLGYPASPDHIRRAPTIRGLLELLAKESPPIHPEALPPQFPLGPMPRKFFERLPLKNRDHWNQSIMVRFDQSPEVPRLERAIQAVQEHHRLLRAGVGEDRLLTVSPVQAKTLPFHDLSQVPFFLRPRRLKALVQALQSSCGLEARRIHQIMLVKLSPEDVRLIWAAHHLVVDAHCWRVLLEDLVSAYQEPEMPLLQSGDYSDYSLGVQGRMASEAATAFCLLKNRFRLPFNQPEGSNSEAEQASMHLVLSVAETDRLEAQAHRSPGLTFHHLLLSAVSQALGRWRGQRSVSMDVISQGRDVLPGQDFSRTVGWFATHNPFHITLPEDQKAPALLHAVQAAWAAHQATSPLFVEHCNQALRDPSHPLHGYQDNDVLYNFLGMFDNLRLPHGWQVLGSAGQDRDPENPRTHALEFEAFVIGGRLTMQFIYSRAQFPPRSVRRFRNHLKLALEDLALDPLAESLTEFSKTPSVEVG